MNNKQLIDVAPYLKNVGLLKNDPSDELSLNKDIDEAFLDLMRNTQEAANCVRQIYVDGIPVSQEFFAQLREFDRWLGFSECRDEALGLVWSEAIRQLSPAQQYQLLNLFAEQQGSSFFETAGSLWVVTRDISLPSSFLANWFVLLILAVERDHMQSGAWNAIGSCCSNHAVVALEVLQIYFSDPNKHRLEIAAFMLGVLRTENVGRELPVDLDRLEIGFRESEEQVLRSVFNWSWVACWGRECCSRSLNRQ